MTVSQHPQSAAILADLATLASQAASTKWRGLLVIRADQKVDFNWPAQALVLAKALSSYREYLGISCSLLVLDMRRTLHGDALAAMLPTVSGQGLVVLVLPTQDSPFTSRLLSTLPRQLSHCVQLQPCADSTCCQVDLSAFKLPITTTPPTSSHYLVSHLKPQQGKIFSQLVAHIHQQVPAPALINAPRGRGKSTLLGVLARELSQQGHPVWLCAPSRRQAATLIHAAGTNTHIHYIAPDVLLGGDSDPVEGYLIVDEAASLPHHMLDILVERYPRVIMATTSEGYETCGRGFLLQFQAQLRRRFRHFLALQLDQPIRFAANCPLENWLNHALLMNPSELNPSDSLSTKPARVQKQDKISYSLQHASKLDDPTLARCFYLLMDAHYQTSPNDLKLLLNDATQSLCLQWCDRAGKADKILTGVLWLSAEGGIEHALARAVVQGTRRPPGNLLAQSLARHLQTPAPASATWLRVVRIAVQTDIQQQGLGSALLEHVISHYKKTDEHTQYAGIGTSFASAAQINRFWNRHGFHPIRIGSRRDSATGRRSLLMLLPLRADWAHSIATWAEYFHHELTACQQLYELSVDYVGSLNCNEKSPGQPSTPNDSSHTDEMSYTAWAEHRINAFACGHLDLDSIRPTLLTYFPSQVEHHPLLRVAVLKPTLNHADKDRLQLTGRKDLIQQVRQVCLQLLAKI